ncbi:predicted protein [Nematostella vectensis]|uniref:Glutathione transferase n=1 Tax=Nematostella vectensis TaxID=45351 RepID=A7RK47_NEMVE|nr:predicted protein [Nematostella vectensis]|eukprot:XP_001640165.1 predicted protein [Nematostella vectensis]
MAERSNAGIQLTFALIALVAAVFYSGKGQFLLNKLNQIAHGKHGCAPITDIGQVTLHYFGSRGKAEGIRLMMEDNGVLYAETNYTKEDWPTVKQKGIQTGLFTFGQVPAITTTTGLQLVQSRAIMHHLGRSLGLDCDCQDLHTCEMLVQGADDLKSKMGSVMYSDSFSSATRDAHIKNTVHVWLPFFERLAPMPEKEEPEEDTREKSGDTDKSDKSKETKPLYWVGDRITWVDYVIFELLDAHVEFGRLDFQGEGTKVDIFHKYPNLEAFYKGFASRPKLAAYLKAQHRVPFWKYKK